MVTPAANAKVFDTGILLNREIERNYFGMA